MQEASRSQDEHLHEVLQQVAALHQQVHDQTAQIRKVTAEAASEQASAKYLIKHLQHQLLSSQAEKAECIQTVQAPTEDTGWSIQHATASVARVLQVMAASQTN